MSSHLAGPLTIKVRRPRALRAAHACALIARDLPARQDELDGAAATDKSPEERAPHARTDDLVPTEKIAGKKRCAMVIDNSEAKEEPNFNRTVTGLLPNCHRTVTEL